MSTTFGQYYRTGTVTLTNGSVNVTSVGALFTDVVQGDILEAQGLQATIDVVTNTTLALMLPWVGTGGAGLSYVIRKDAKSRFDPALTQAKLREFIASIQNSSIIVAVAAGQNPDPAVGDDGQYALRIAGGIWTIWLKVTGSWVLQGSPAGGLIYDLLGWSPGLPGSNEPIASALFNRTVVLPANFAGSQVSLAVAPTSSYVISLQKNGVQFGTLTVAAGQTTVGTWSAPSTTFGPGDTFDAFAPTVRDATASNVRLSIAALRT